MTNKESYLAAETREISYWAAAGILMVMLVLTGCSESSVTESTQPVQTVTTVSSPTAAQTSTSAIASSAPSPGLWVLARWSKHLNDELHPFLSEFNDRFGAEQLAEASVDCILAETRLDAWRLDLYPGPDEETEALVDVYFNQLEAMLEACAKVQTREDWIGVAAELDKLLAIRDRITGTD